MKTSPAFGFARGGLSFSFPTHQQPQIAAFAWTEHHLTVVSRRSSRCYPTLCVSVIPNTITLSPISLSTLVHLFRLLPNSVSHHPTVSNTAVICPASACTRNSTHHRDPPITYPADTTASIYDAYTRRNSLSPFTSHRYTCAFLISELSARRRKRCVRRRRRRSRRGSWRR